MKKKLSIEGQLVSSQGVQRKFVTIDCDSGLFESIEEVGPAADYVFNDNCLLFAAPIDVHIHAREDESGQHLYKEDFCSAASAAINGGVHALADMPNNPCPPLDQASYLRKLQATAKASIPILPYAAVLPQSEVLPFAVPYKVYLGPSVGELTFSGLKEVDRKLAAYHGQRVSFHCEDAGILERHKKEKSHHQRRPVEAELVSTQFALEMIEKHRLYGKLCHFSASQGLELIRKAKKRGVQVQVEVTPQHLFFSQEKIRAGSFPFPKEFFQMNPPIRGEEDRLALLEALKAQELDFLATDHAPHSYEEKTQGTSGITGLDTYGPFLTHLMVDEGVAPQMLAKMCCENPGDFMNPFLKSLAGLSPWGKKFGEGFGFFRPGFSASFTVLDLQKPLTITTEILKTKSAWSPFLGHTFAGSVKMFFHQGKLL